MGESFRQLLPRDVADQRDMRSTCDRLRVLTQGSQSPSVPSLSESRAEGAFLSFHRPERASELGFEKEEPLILNSFVNDNREAFLVDAEHRIADRVNQSLAGDKSGLDSLGHPIEIDEGEGLLDPSAAGSLPASGCCSDDRHEQVREMWCPLDREVRASAERTAEAGDSLNKQSRRIGLGVRLDHPDDLSDDPVKGLGSQTRPLALRKRESLDLLGQPLDLGYLPPGKIRHQPQGLDLRHWGRAPPGEADRVDLDPFPRGSACKSRTDQPSRCRVPRSLAFTRM